MNLIKRVSPGNGKPGRLCGLRGRKLNRLAASLQHLMLEMQARGVSRNRAQRAPIMCRLAHRQLLLGYRPSTSRIEARL